jgi:acyl-CoA thioesterase-1
VPFMLEGVAGNPDLNLPDGIHPTAAGQERVADNVLPRIEEILLQLLSGHESGSAQNSSEDGPP